ncbi:MAG: 4Fe-4S dicluster domain-containing protein [Desulfotomaculales bacterium]
MSLTGELKEFAFRLGLADIGAAPVSRYAEAPPGHKPNDYLPGAKSVITFAYRLNEGPLRNLPATRNQYNGEFNAVNQILLNCAHQLARFLEERGYASVAFGPEADIGDYSRLKGDFSHKHSAVLCGLGKFGVNNLLLHPRYRARIRLASVVTTAELDYAAPAVEALCDTCLECVRICPSGALNHWEGNYHPERGWVIDKEKCAHYMFVTHAGKRCGLCIHACLRS